MTSSLRICILLIALFCNPVQNANGSFTSDLIFSAPVTEAKEVIEDWLKNNGFQSIHENQEKNLVTIEAWHAGTAWLIELSSHTPLATRIHLTSERETSEQLASLRAYLDHYNHVSSSTEGIVNEVIPPVVKDHLEAVVCIYASRKGHPLQLSGFCIDRKGLIASTAHDLIDGQSVRVQFLNGNTLEGRVIKLDKRRDLCLVKVPVTLQTIISLRNGRYAPGRDEALFAMGCPQGASATIQVGALDGPPRRVQGLPLWQARMHIEPGSSGSPVLDGRGRLTAIVKGRFRGTDAVGFLIPFETLLHFLGKY